MHGLFFTCIWLYSFTDVLACIQLHGGGILVHFNAAVNLISTSVSSNTAGGDGGGIYQLFGGYVYMTDSELVDNSAGSDVNMPHLSPFHPSEWH